MRRAGAWLGLLLVVLTWSLAGSAAAVAAAPVGPVDARIRTLFYDPDQVFVLGAVFGYQMMIQFGPDERIENVSIGDGSAWQVTPNKKATLLFIKPVETATDTNMTVVTDRRAYLFEMRARVGRVGAPPPPYIVRFLYPVDPAVAAAAAKVASTNESVPPERRNTAYSYTGSRATLPSLVFDDGKFTYFKWPDSASTPALFLVGADNSESLVNYSVRDGYQVVEQVAPRFRLRNGRQITTVINEGWREPTPDAGSPRPHDARTARDASRAEGAH